MAWTCDACGESHEDGFDSCWSCGWGRDGRPPQHDLDERFMGLPLPCVTTPAIAGREILGALGVVGGEAILGANILRDLLGSLADVLGGRAGSYETKLREGRRIALREMAGEAMDAGGDAVVGVKIDYETVRDTMLMVCATGTAVTLVPLPSDAAPAPAPSTGFTVLHVPHASLRIPAEERVAFVVDGRVLAAELLAMTDRWTEELFALPPERAEAVIHPVSRLVVDPERFEDDAVEEMERKGMGAVYTHGHDGRRLRADPTFAARDRLLDRWYRPHHARLRRAVESALRRRGLAFVLDAHSFPAKPHPYENHQEPDRPSICLGTDDFHTPPWLVEEARRLFEAAGWSVAVDRPFAGALVPAPFHGTEPRVLALMVEVNRALYMDEGTGARLEDFDFVAARLQETLLRLLDAVEARLASRS